jgi:hypothetical protein
MLLEGLAAAAPGSSAAKELGWQVRVCPAATHTQHGHGSFSLLAFLPVPSRQHPAPPPKSHQVTQLFLKGHTSRWVPGRLSPPVLLRLTGALVALGAVPGDTVVWPWLKAAVCFYSLYQPDVSCWTRAVAGQRLCANAQNTLVAHPTHSLSQTTHRSLQRRCWPLREWATCTPPLPHSQSTPPAATFTCAAPQP